MIHPCRPWLAFAIRPERPAAGERAPDARVSRAQISRPQISVCPGVGGMFASGFTRDLVTAVVFVASFLERREILWRQGHRSVAAGCYAVESYSRPNRRPSLLRLRSDAEPQGGDALLRLILFTLLQRAYDQEVASLPLTRKVWLVE